MGLKTLRLEEEMRQGQKGTLESKRTHPYVPRIKRRHKVANPQIMVFNNTPVLIWDVFECRFNQGLKLFKDDLARLDHGRVSQPCSATCGFWLHCKKMD
jgi:hypothetical protein